MTQEIRPISRFSQEDLTDLRRLSLNEDWPHSLEDWRTIMASGEVFGHRAVSGQVLSSTAVIPYGTAGGQQLAALGMVIVDTTIRRRGLGQALVREAIDWAAKQAPSVPLALIATQIGLPLYEKLGFRTVEHLHKFVRPAGGTAGDTHRVAGGRELRTLDEALQISVCEIDTTAFGCRRDRFLAQRIAQAETGLVLFDGEQPMGYGLLVRQGALAILGPVVAPDDDGALAIISCLISTTDSAFRIDLPERQKRLFPMLEAMGFVEDDVPPIMLQGLDLLPGEQGRYYAIAAQAFG